MKDKKFVVGTVLLVVMILFLMGGFWTTVVRQAKMDAYQEKQEELLSRRVICLQREDTKEALFWDMDEGTCLEVELPAGIFNRNGVFIKGDVLEYGDMVRLYGGEFSEEDYPPTLSSLTKAERLGRATLEEAASYQEELDKALVGAKEPGEEAQETTGETP